MLIDSHCHLTAATHLPQELTACINHASNADDLSAVLQSLAIPKVFGAIGVHPWAASESFNLKDWAASCAHPKIVALGEIGLDFSSKRLRNAAAQMSILEQQFMLAHELKLPVVLHCVKASHLLLALIKKYKLTGCVHGFSGSLEEANQFSALGFKIGINWRAMQPPFKKMQRLAAYLAPQNILLESDFPYAAPHMNTLSQLLRFLAQLRSAKEALLQKQIAENTLSIFGEKLRI